MCTAEADPASEGETEAVTESDWRPDGVLINVSTPVGSPEALGAALDEFSGSAVSAAVWEAKTDSVAASDITDCEAVLDAAETVGNDDCVAQSERLAALEALVDGDHVSLAFPDPDPLPDGDHVKVGKVDPDALSVGNRVEVIFIDAERLSVEISVRLEPAETVGEPAGVVVRDRALSDKSVVADSRDDADCEKDAFVDVLARPESVAASERLPLSERVATTVKDCAGVADENALSTKVWWLIREMTQTAKMMHALMCSHRRIHWPPQCECRYPSESPRR